MYLPDADVDRTSLWQGDVIRDVQLVAAINLRGITHNTPVGGSEATSWTVSGKPLVGDAMVLSHSCELDRANSVKVTSIILAPLRDINTATAPDKVEHLKSTNLLSVDGQKESFLKYFVVEPTEHLFFTAGAVVDFSKCFSIRNQCYDFLLARKVLQLRPDIRDAMALKLALFFHRQAAAATP